MEKIHLVYMERSSKGRIAALFHIVGGIFIMQPNWLAQRSYLTPNRVALSFQNDQWTFKELHLEAISIAEKLATLHLRSGDRVAILSPSRPELIMMI